MSEMMQGIHVKSWSDKGVVKEVITERLYARKVVSPSSQDRWLDAGGHIGSFPVSMQGTPYGEIHSYEPVLANYKVLLENARELPNVHAHRACLVGNTDTERRFWARTEGNMATGSYVKPYARSKIEQIVVPAENIEEVIRQHKLSCIKMDVEGAELELLYSLPASVMLRIRIVMLEYHDFIHLDPTIKKKLVEYLGIWYRTVIVEKVGRPKEPNSLIVAY